MRVSFFRVATADERHALAVAAVCLPQRYCGVLWRGSLKVAREDRDLDAWHAAAKELLRNVPPPPRGAVARLIVDPSLDGLGLRAVLLEATYVRKKTTAEDWEELLRVRLPQDGSDSEN